MQLEIKKGVANRPASQKQQESLEMACPDMEKKYKKYSSPKPNRILLWYLQFKITLTTL